MHIQQKQKTVAATKESVKEKLTSKLPAQITYSLKALTAV